jgi:hypothetical protein
MIKHYKFRCWKCRRVYYESLEITNQQKVIVTCPYCWAEAVVNLESYYKELKTVLKRDGDNKTDTSPQKEFQAPEIFPTLEPE